MSRIIFMNIEIDNLTMDEVLNAADELIQKKKNAYLVTPNVDHMVQLNTDRELQKIYAGADLVVTDGKPLIWISRLYGTPIKEKISGSDLFPLLCGMSAEKGYSIFLLGAAEGVAAKAAENLKARYPGLKIAGTYSPPFGFEKDESETRKSVEAVKAAKPDILIVGLGSPKQEKFIYAHREELNVPLSLGLGASIDFESGYLKRAPKWMSNCGLEWLYRVIQDPKRLVKRYWNDAVHLVPLIKKYKD